MAIRVPGPTNYTLIAADGHMTHGGTGTQYNDLLGDITKLKVVGSGISDNETESTIDILTSSNLLDYIYANYQMSHAWLPGSVVQPHIHFEQAQNQIPNFLIRYRWQINLSGKTTAWANYKCNTPVATYVSGTLNQIAKGAGITPPAGYNISDILQLRIFRDNANASGVFTGADPYTVTVALTSADIHIEMDSAGSNTEYSKT